MKRLFKILAYLLGTFIVLAGIGVAFIYFRGVPHYPYNPPAEVAALKVQPDSARIERGAKIATLLCNNCHTGQDGKLIGRMMPDVPKALAPSYSMNITHDKVHGIGDWTDGELYYFLRTGIHKDGHWSPPFMPKFPLMADEDLYSIIAWLRSDAPALAADPREFPPNKWNLFVKFLTNVAMKPPKYPDGPITIPDTSNLVAFGRYVADDLCACYACHSADFAKVDMGHPEKSLGYYGGGNPLLNNEGEIVHSANITPDKETGIGNWTEAEFADAVRFCKNPRGGLLYYPMFPHTTLSDQEVKAAWAYLQTVPPIHNAVDRYKPKN